MSKYQALKRAAQQTIDAYDAFGEADDAPTLFELSRKIAALQRALSQPAPSPQPAVPVVSDERPAVEPMTPEQRGIMRMFVSKLCAFQGKDEIINTTINEVEAHHGITAKAEDTHQPTKEAEKP